LKLKTYCRWNSGKLVAKSENCAVKKARFFCQLQPSCPVGFDRSARNFGVGVPGMQIACCFLPQTSKYIVTSEFRFCAENLKTNAKLPGTHLSHTARLCCKKEFGKCAKSKQQFAKLKKIFTLNSETLTCFNHQVSLNKIKISIK
jgi:hypothetical protein